MTFTSPTSAQISALRLLWKEAFGDTDEFLDLFFDVAFSPDRALCAMEGEALAAMLYWFDCTLESKRVAYVYAVATARNFRGRGVGSALMRELHGRLQKSGYAGAILVPSEASLFDFYARFGYTHITELAECEAKAEPTELSLREIDAVEYAERRRALLPRNAIVQEGVCSEFLAAQASFYASDDCILAAHREGKRLICKEILYADDVCPPMGEIVSALGCKSGRFRTVGCGMRFAAYCDLGEKILPRYFAFAFD